MIFIVKHRAHNSLTLLNNLLNIVLIHTRLLFKTLVDALLRSAMREGNHSAGNKRRIRPAASKNSYCSAMPRLIRKIIKKSSAVLPEAITQRRTIE